MYYYFDNDGIQTGNNMILKGDNYKYNKWNKYNDKNAI